MRGASRGAAGEGGYTLPELLVALVISLLVATAGATLVVSMVRAQPATTERAGQIQQGRTMLETITRELRQGESVLSASESSLSVLTYVRSASCGGDHSDAALLCRVDYSCTASACTRTERPPTGTATGSTRTLVAGITGPNVFGAAGPDPAYVSVRLVYPQHDGEEAVTLEDGAALRNHFDSVAGS